MKAEKSHPKAIDTTIITDDPVGLLRSLFQKVFIKSSPRKGQTLIQISDGSVGYLPDQPLLSRINLSISTNEYVAIIGENGGNRHSLKLFLKMKSIYKTTGNWSIIKQDAGYLDQDYNTLTLKKNPFLKSY